MKSSKPFFSLTPGLIVATLFILVSLFQTPALSVPQKTDTRKMLNEGKIVFQTNCATCHGTKGTGDGPASVALNPKPRNFVTGKFKYGNSDHQLFKTISNGVSGSAMAPWKGTLTDKQINNVIIYLKSLKK